MVGLTRSVPRFHEALSDARRSDFAQVDEGLRRFGFTGVHGEPEVGTTSVIETAIARSGQESIRVDLDGAASEADVAWMLAHGLARTVIGHVPLSLLSAPAIAPTEARRALVGFAEQVGERMANFAVSHEPIQGVSVVEALTAITQVWDRAAAPPILWIDHLQAPQLTPRHPIDVNALLWNIRGAQQQIELPIIVSGSKAVTQVAYGRSGAFHGDGTWVDLGRPDTAAWQDVAKVLGTGAPSPEWVNEMATTTHHHPATMLLALALSAEVPERATAPLELWQLMLSLDDGLTGRAMQHARSLHRLGGFVLDRIAHGVGPYEGAQTKAERNDRNRAVNRLYEGGLITQPRARVWEITNPMLAGRLRRKMPMTPTEAHPLEVAERGALGQPA
jgi:hypothetical protein